MRVCQQKMHGWAPRPSVATVLCYYIAASSLLLALGGLQFSLKSSVKQVSVRYDDHPGIPGKTCEQRYNNMLRSDGEGVPVELTFTVTEHMKAPVYVFYSITDFISGHKRFQRSRDDYQLAGDEYYIKNPQASCQPQAYIGSDTAERSGDNENNGAITPCGLIGWSQFNDTFEIHHEEEPGTSRNVEILEEGIAWPTDKEYLFGDVPAVNYNINASLRGGNSTEQLLSESEHLIVWFRTSSKPDIVYRWGTIEHDLEPGSYRLKILNRYNSYGFCGEKRFVLTTNTWVGGGRRFLSILYLAAGCGFLATLILFLLAFFFWRRRETGNAEDLSWNRDVKQSLLTEQPISPQEPLRKPIPAEAQGLI